MVHSQAADSERAAGEGERAQARRAQASGSASRVRSLAFVGLTVALFTVSAWVSVPFGPVPFTLQTFAIVFAVLTLRPSESLGALAAYYALGFVGVPVFSSMRGGIGVLAGPTGGFLWGFLAGAVVVVVILRLLGRFALPSSKRRVAVWALAATAFMLVTYAIGWVQLVFVSGMSPEAAFVSAVAPFIVVDACKMVAAVAVAGAVRRALGMR